MWCCYLGESKSTKKKKRRKRGQPEAEFKLSLRKTTFFHYKGPARYIKFIAIILVLGLVNIVGEFGIASFPENLAALFLCMMIIGIVGLILQYEKGK